MRLIDSDSLGKVKFHPLPYTHITPTDADAESYKRGWNDAIDAIMSETPTIEERKGKWIRETKHYKDSEQEFYYYEERCSECGTKRKIGWAEVRYCPNCGVKLEGEEHG